ncbi:MBL fold metallo-hydrolase [Maritimibacter dapengensis]|uniref:MBL fold metallo-hydrolase n=1 Tax=Maritimibacter dapengensis TaxID=2836868 RepID=A0ABS6T2L2_9RHOB|nr:MBL fold metallo-hydrolase [Maritimibacter dapengensis]MBV7379215.1 MBL fold metallo-hydrolase [Maritimibacter dapengensis]
MLDDLYFSDNTQQLQASIRGLFGTPTAPLPFLDGVVVRAFVLDRPQGNIIIYNAPGISEAADETRELGQPQRLLMNHHHEAMYGAPDLDVPVWVHEADRSRVSLPIAGTFAERHMIDDDLEVIPTPGHTAGTTAFLWDNGEHRFLFPGDSLWVQGGEWKAVLLGDSNRSAYLDSLARLKTVDFDVLVPWGAEVGEPFGYAVTREEANANLDRIIARLEAGENA